MRVNKCFSQYKFCSTASLRHKKKKSVGKKRVTFQPINPFTLSWVRLKDGPFTFLILSTSNSWHYLFHDSNKKVSLLIEHTVQLFPYNKRTNFPLRYYDNVAYLKQQLFYGPQSVQSVTD